MLVGPVGLNGYHALRICTPQDDMGGAKAFQTLRHGKITTRPVMLGLSNYIVGFPSLKLIARTRTTTFAVKA